MRKIYLFLLLAFLVLVGCWGFKIYKASQDVVNFPTIVPKANNVHNDHLIFVTPVKYTRYFEGDSINITWDSSGFENFGNVVDICLFGYDNNEIAVTLKEPYVDQECSYPDVLDKTGLRISSTKLTNEKYSWKIPDSLLSYYNERLKYFKIRLLVLDNLPPEGRTEWEGQIVSTFSDSFLILSKTEVDSITSGIPKN